MPSNLIVKAKWLPFSKLAAAEHEALAAAVLHGSAPASAKKLPAAERAYLEEKCLQVSGKPAELLRKTSELGPAPTATTQRPLWDERLFLHAYALSRLGREAEAEAEFAQLPSRFQSRIQTERALRYLNQGSITEAEALFARAKESATETQTDPFSACTLLGGLSLALLSSGQFKAAEDCLKQRREILRAHPSPPLAFGTSLYEILLSLEHNHFDAAETKLRRAMAEFERRSVNGFFLLHLGLRLALARNDLTRAGEILAELKDLRSALQLPDGVLDLRLEEIEWHLRGNRSGEARALLKSLAQAAAEKRDDNLKFRVGILQGLALWREGEAAAGAEEIERAIQLGEARNYRPNLSWAFFHGAGVALAANQPVRARLFLARGRRLAEELRLPARLAAFSYVHEVLENKYAGASSLVSLAKHQQIGPELEYFLSAYRILDTKALHVRQGRHQETLDEPKLRQKLFREPGLFWFQREAVLVVNQGAGDVRHLDFSAREHQLLLFRLLWSAHQDALPGLRLEDVHHARLTTPFREHLHGAAAKMALSRLRATLKSYGLGLEYSRQSRRYSLTLPQLGYTIQSVAAAKAGHASRQREIDILQRIEAETFVATNTLCEEFGVSRQALHPLLRRLCAQGKLKLVRRGPTSGYMYRG